MANIIVLFEVTPTKEGMQKYLDLAAMLKPMLAGFESASSNAIQLDVRENVRFAIEFFQKYQKSYL